MKVRLLVSVLFLLRVVLQLQAANLQGGGVKGPDVTLQDEGVAVVLSNGIVTARILKAGASIPSLRYREQEMASAIYYSMDGGKDFSGPSQCDYTVKEQTPDMVDISLKSVWKGQRKQAFDIDVHYVLRRGNTGIYSYAILEHPASYPESRVGEWRMVWKLSNDLLEKIYVDDLRHWEMPSSKDYKHAETTPIKEITKLTTGVLAGKYDCKYDFSASYYDIGCWGHASDRNKIGGWIVLGGYDFFNDGPTKQDLNAASGINHLHFGMDHYNASVTTAAAGENWQKIYGPYLLYCNTSEKGGDACWADAKAQVIAEKAAWPYAWLTNNPAYPLAVGRGTVTGRFVVKDALKPTVNGAGAWVGVAQPPPGGNWQFESNRYQYWVKADARGNFTIPQVRPGIYTLSAFNTGAVGEFTKTEVSVAAGKTTALNDLTWEVPHHGGKIAWEIGVPDRTAKEFRYGNDYFHGYLWQKIAENFPNPLEYTVGKSDWTKDWNYAQHRYPQGTSGTDFVPHVWKIHFDLPEAPQPTKGDATLTLAIASAQRATIAISVNDEAKPSLSVSPSVQGGNALLRESIHAKYCVETVTIPAAKLHAGANTLTLSCGSPRAADSHVMYDYLSLELP